MAAKSKVAGSAKKATAKKATGKARGRPKGLQLSNAQQAAYNKAFTATAQKLSRAATIRAFATGLRKYRLQAANTMVRKYNIARGNAQTAAIAAHAASQSLMQAKLGHQNAALLTRIGADAFRHAALLGRMQYAQAGIKAYAHRNVMNTVTQKQAVSLETKFLSKVVKTAKKAAGKRGRPKGTPLSKAIGAAATAAGKAAAAKVPKTAQGTVKTSTAKTKAAASNVKAAAKAAATSKKAPAKAAKTRTAPMHPPQVASAVAAAHAAAATAHAMAAYTGAAAKSKPSNYLSRQEWLGDEYTPNCIVTAVANHMLSVKSVRATEKELLELTELAGDKPTIEGVLWQVYLTGWPGRNVHLGTYQEVSDERQEEEGLVIGFEVHADDGWADHCALSRANYQAVSWGAERDRESLVEEAWELTWLVLKPPASRWSWRLQSPP